MKKILTMAFTALTLYACSSGPEEVDLPSTLTSKQVVFDQEPPANLFCSSDAQVLKLNFTVNSMWNIPANPTGFITVSPSRGFEGAQSVSINVQENTGAARSQVLKISCLAEDDDTAIRTVTIHQEAAAALPPFTISPIFTPDTAPIIAIGDYYDFTLTGIDEVRMGGGDSTISFVGATPTSNYEKYISFSNVPGEPKKVRVTNVGIWGGLRWGIQFHRCADGARTQESYVNIPMMFDLSPISPESAPALCLPYGNKTIEFTFDRDDAYNKFEMAFPESGYFSLEAVPGQTRKLVLKNNAWTSGKIAVRFKRKSDGVLSARTWITSSGSYIPFVEIIPEIGVTSSANTHGNYYDIPSGTVSTLSYRLQFQPSVTGQIKVTLDPWEPSGTHTLNTMFYTGYINTSQGYTYKLANDNTEYYKTEAVSYIQTNVERLSVTIYSIKQFEGDPARFGTITFEYGGEKVTITIYQGPNV